MSNSDHVKGPYPLPLKATGCYRESLGFFSLEMKPFMHLFPTLLTVVLLTAILSVPSSAAPSPYQDWLPQYRPPNLPTYTPTSTTINLTDFSSWVSNQVYTLKHFELAFATGTYYVPSVSPSNFPFYFRALSHTILWFDQVLLIFTDPAKQGFQFDSCTNVTLRGVTTTYSQYTFSQGQVVNVTANGTSASLVTVKTCAGYPSTYLAAAHYGYVFNSSTLQPYQPGYRVEIFPTSITSVSSDTFQWLLNNTYVTGVLRVGDYIGVRGTFNQFHVFSNSANMTYIDVTLLSCGGYAFFSSGGYGNHTYKRVKVTYGPPPVPGGVPPLITCSADGFHHIGSEHGPSLTNSLFEGMQDDAVNLQGLWGFVTSRLASDQFLITYDSRTHWNFEKYQVGDTLRFYNPISYAPIGTATISSVTFPNPSVYWNLTVKLSGSILPNIQVGYMVSDLAQQNSGFLIANNTLRNHRARGMLIKASNGLVADNIVEGNSIGGILLIPEMKDFTESDYAQNVTITRNWIRNADYFTYGAGSINVFWNSANFASVPVGGFFNISIYNNTIMQSNRQVCSAATASITNNVIVGPLSVGFPAIALYNDDSVTMSGNVLLNAASRDALLTQVNVSNSYNLPAGITKSNAAPPSFPISPFDIVKIGNGLLGSYYSDVDFTYFVAQRVDATVGFTWGSGDPGITGIGADYFSIRWTGYVLAKCTGTYTFSTVSDDGVRLYVNGVMIINNWAPHASVTDNGSTFLVAGRSYPIQLDFNEVTGDAQILLYWQQGACEANAIIPQSSLFSSNATLY